LFEQEETGHQLDTEDQERKEKAEKEKEAEKRRRIEREKESVRKQCDNYLKDLVFDHNQ
jgi:hypothetical protein